MSFWVRFCLSMINCGIIMGMLWLCSDVFLVVPTSMVVVF